MKPHTLAIVACSFVFVASCAGDTTAPTPARLSATVTPNPMTAPTEGGGSDLLFNLELRAGTSGTVSLQEGDAQLLDATGTIVGRTKQFWSQESGCAICPPQVRRLNDAGSAGAVEADLQVRLLLPLR